MHRLAVSVALAALFGAACPDSDLPAAPTPARPVPEAPRSRPKPVPPDRPPIRSDGTMLGTSELMGTTVSLNVYVGPGGDAERGAAAMTAALREMARIEALMSEWQPKSELSRLNASAGGPATLVSSELFDVLTTAKRVHADSNGLFDVTFHSVGRLWSFKPGSKPPSPQAIARALPNVDGSKVELDSSTRTVRLPSTGMKIGLGAIAKGYAVDRASSVLTRLGFPHHVVEAGGDTFASGSKGGVPWRVGVKNPDRAGSVGALEVEGRAVVTSGDYMRFFEHEGQRYAHILNPKTGWPVERSASPKSVTLLAGSATEADAYCTAVTVMGGRAGLSFVEARTDLEAVIIGRDDELFVTAGLADTYRPLPAPLRTAP